MNDPVHEREPSSPEGAPARPPRERPRFSAADWLTLLPAAVLSLLFFRVFGLDALGQSGLPGLGITVFVFALFAAVFLVLGRRVRLEPAGCALCLAALALSLTFALYDNVSLRILNCLAVLVIGAMGILRISGLAEKSLRQAAVLWETAALSCAVLFRHVDKPFRALLRLTEGGKKRFSGIALGLIVALPVLGAVLMLLTSADEVFRALFLGLGEWLAGIGAARLLWRVFRTLLLTLLIFSALYALPRGRSGQAAAPAGAHAVDGEAARLPLIVVLTLLDFVYLVFVAIQFAFLFGGAEAAAMKGGWAAYARSGFFQLVGVSCINLAAVLTAAVLGADGAKKGAPGRRVLLALSALLLAFTAVILCSALWRMWLYISVYGLSLLRALTLWGMAFLAVCLAAAGLRMFRPGFRFFPVFLAAGLVLWLAFSFVNIDGRVADYNVNAWLRGDVEQVDTDYLTALGPDALPALRRLHAADPEAFSDRELAAFENRLGEKAMRMTWREWNLSLARAKKPPLSGR